jgi:hypothetical protein
VAPAAKALPPFHRCLGAHEDFASLVNVLEVRWPAAPESFLKGVSRAFESLCLGLGVPTLCSKPCGVSVRAPPPPLALRYSPSLLLSHPRTPSRSTRSHSQT